MAGGTYFALLWTNNPCYYPFEEGRPMAAKGKSNGKAIDPEETAGKAKKEKKAIVFNKQ